MVEAPKHGGSRGAVDERVHGVIDANDIGATREERALVLRHGSKTTLESTEEALSLGLNAPFLTPFLIFCALRLASMARAPFAAAAALRSGG